MAAPAAHLEPEADEAEARRRRHLKALVLARQRGDGLRQADVVPGLARLRVSACQQECTQASQQTANSQHDTT